MYPTPPGQPSDFPQMFAEERERIRVWRKNRGVPEEDGDGRLDLIGLAFSGGGIRSATFNLGVLQALAKMEILHFVDYLSTVSGGGYIGGWLAAMVHRLPGGMREAEEGLDPDQVKANVLPQKAIAHLRAFSNYLTPKVSLLSADTWSMITIWARNTLLNLVTLVCGIAALILFGRFAGLESMVLMKWMAPRWCTLTAFGIAGVALALTLRGWTLWPVAPAGREYGWPPRRFRNDYWVQRLVILPALAGAVLMTFEVYARPLRHLVWGGILLTAMFAGLQLLARFWEWFLHHHEKKGAWILDALLQLGVAAVSGFVTSCLFHAVSWGIHSFDGLPYSPWLVFTAGPPAVLLAVSLGVTVNVGLMGRDLPDDTREWLGRAGAWAAIYGAGWLLFFGVAFWGPLELKRALDAYTNWWARSGVTLAWVAVVWRCVTAAKSSQTGGEQGGGIRNLVALALPAVFLLGSVSLIGLGVHELTAQPACSTAAAIAVSPGCLTPQKPGQVSPATWYWGEMNAQERSTWLWKNPYGKGSPSWYKGLLEVMLLAVAVTLLMAWRVDVNAFSLHHFYKNRLVRCYLGASRTRQARHANPFTNFDPDDDFPLNHLDDAGYSGPFPIVNSTLNLSSGRNLAWQERKGAPFIFTPVYSGFDTGRDASGTSASRSMRVGEHAGGAPALPGYYPTHLVARTAYRPESPGAQPPPGFAGDGILLGTAVAISGAAANPNQGFHTSTAVAFLMTVFNVRLGWWLGNPVRRGRGGDEEQDKARAASPVFGLGYTLAELFGTTTADSAFVNLSDGGHFDNMGLYELVRRRCRYIIVCDAEQDEGLGFSGLGAAIRMCRTDFGARIDISLDPIARRPDNKPESFSGCHCAVGTITYGDGTTGKLVYLKSSLTGDEPADVLAYHKQVAQFPHESTADQWFDESQFESYRALGYHVARKALGAGRDPLTAATKQRFFDGLEGCPEPV